MESFASASEEYFETSYPFHSLDIDGAAIASALAGLGGIHTWIDLGCGPILPIWAAFQRSARELIGLDGLDENVRFLRGQIERREMLEPHRRALRFARDSLGFGELSHAESAHLLFGRIVAIEQWNVLEFCQRWSGKCDLVSQVGCFGCLQSVTQVAKALSNARGYLRPGGKFLSVTWIQEKYDGQVGWNGPVSAELTRDSIMDLCFEAGMAVTRADRLQTRDPTYDAMVLIEAIRTDLG